MVFKKNSVCSGAPFLVKEISTSDADDGSDYFT
jgi:hypothetical protein